MSGTGDFIVPLQAVASQTVSVTLGAQPCTISVYQKVISVQDTTGAIPTVTPLFLDLYINGVLTVGGCLCRNTVKLVRDAYLGFVGDLVFYDTEGDADPVYTGLGSRFILVYLPSAL